MSKGGARLARHKKGIALRKAAFHSRLIASGAMGTQPEKLRSCSCGTPTQLDPRGLWCPSCRRYVT